ncbi:MAG: hypothetical protein LBJ60_00205 [Tannerellaceae bacterium]|jgi:hypothetical protein|nr:hypothetical protein [Tannerellaceae bacterium]
MMKTQVTKVWAIFSLLLFTMAAYGATMDSTGDKLKGAWTYSLPDAPYGYQDGRIEFKEAEGKLTAVVLVGNASYTIKEIKKEGDLYHCSLYVDGNDLKISFKPDKEELKGTVVAVTEGWEMPVTFRKINE